MKVYKVKVNGKVYEVELESVSENEAKIEAEKEEVKEEVEEEVSEGTGEEVVIKAPMQGTILKVLVEVGTKVKKNDHLCILEAMKLENEIVSPVDGVIAKVEISKGQTVNNQDLMFVIR